MYTNVVLSPLLKMDEHGTLFRPNKLRLVNPEKHGLQPHWHLQQHVYAICPNPNLSRQKNNGWGWMFDHQFSINIYCVFCKWHISISHLCSTPWKSKGVTGKCLNPKLHSTSCSFLGWLKQLPPSKRPNTGNMALFVAQHSTNSSFEAYSSPVQLNKSTSSYFIQEHEQCFFIFSHQGHFHCSMWTPSLQVVYIYE